MDTLVHSSMGCLRSAACPMAGSCSGLRAGVAGTSSSHRLFFTPRCVARRPAHGTRQSRRVPDPLKAATVEAPKVDRGDDPKRVDRQESIREQAHRRGELRALSLGQNYRSACM
jgi:hypothetical protein